MFKVEGLADGIKFANSHIIISKFVMSQKANPKLITIVPTPEKVVRKNAPQKPTISTTNSYIKANKR